MELRLYFQILRRGWWIILLTALVAIIGALVASYLATPRYTATARFILTPGSIPAAGPDIVYQGLNTIDNGTVTTTYAQVMSSGRIYSDAGALLKLSPNDLLAYTYDAQVLANSSIIELTVEGPNADTAAKLANAIGVKTIELMRRLNPVINIDFLDQAAPPAAASSPQPVRDATLAAVLGLIIGVVLAISSEQLRTSLEVFRHGLHVDSLTGVYNNKYFPRLVEQELARHPTDPLSMGIIELSGLSDLAGTLPESVMQRILRIAVDGLRRELRGGDVIARWNDISFSVMLPHTNAAAARRIFDRILQSLCAPVDLDQFGTIISLDAHIGGVQYDLNISPRELFEEAENALEQARRAKPTQVYVLQPGSPVHPPKELAAS